MKRIIIALMAVATLLAGCAKVSDLKDLEGRVSKLEGQIAALDNTVSGLQTAISGLQAADYIVSVQKVTGGYQLTYAKGGSFTIPEVVPQVVSVVQENGVWYWAIDGAIVTVNGKKAEVLSIKPTFKYEGEDLFVSYDNGASWNKVEGRQEQGTITVEETDAAVIIKTPDGKTIEIPKASGAAGSLALVIIPDNDQLGVTAPLFGDLEINVKVYPAEAAAKLTVDNVKAFANPVIATKAPALVELTVSEVTAAGGVATVKVSGLPAVPEGKSLTVAVEAEVEGVQAGSAYVPVVAQKLDLTTDKWNFADITAYVTDAEGIEVRKAFGKISNTPALAMLWGYQLPETPYSWDVGDWVNFMNGDVFPMPNAMEGQIASGDWPLVDFDGDAAIVLIDPAKFGAKVVFENSETPVTISKAGTFVSISGTPSELPLAVYSDGDYKAAKIYNMKDDITVEGSYGSKSTLGIKEDGSIEFAISYNNYGIQRTEKSILWWGQDEWKWTAASPWNVKQAVTAYPWAYRTGTDSDGGTHADGYPMDNWAMACTDAVQWEPMYGEAWNGNRARSYAGVTADGKIGIATFANVGTYGGAYILHQMGWVDVAQLGTAFYLADGFTPTLVVDGKIITGKADATAFYALGFDKK